ncbi:C-terminal binding protein [Sporolactobacillus terrae]|uniref:Dehydrogenase n=1 Tax=Sporolactobacillus terrae TaxID=269673 RepID=A0A5K7WYY7_9BACL|nr:C-terminal binding protein [Sporolactobacillus terrae]UAK16139.1 C-terminal binding protein [Sporolactobacillus terrae]BBN97563.1 dehydrogenase [Sporolactobacillus terrae]
MKPLIWIIDEEWSDYTIEQERLKQAFPNCVIRYSGNDYQKDLVDFGRYADAILCQVYVTIGKETIEKLEHCKIIAIYGGGYDRVAVDAAKSKGITVTYVPGYCVEDVSDYVISAIYFFNKNLPYYLKIANDGPWGAQAASALTPRIASSTLLIIGFGRIGQKVAEKAQAAHIRVLVHDPRLNGSDALDHGVRKVTLQEGLSEADYVTLHTTYTPETDGLLSMPEFKLMKPTAHVINTSRGRVLNEGDLIEAVKNKDIAGAMLDVIANEPPKGSEAVFSCPNIYVTPHVSYLSIESLTTLKARAVANVITVINGGHSKDAVI